MRPVAPQTDNVQVLGTGGTANLGGQGGRGAAPVEPVTISRVEPKSINIPDFLKRH